MKEIIGLILDFILELFEFLSRLFGQTLRKI